jgi:hypothetical protein
MKTRFLKKSGFFNFNVLCRYCEAEGYDVDLIELTCLKPFDVVGLYKLNAVDP